jgi:CHAD domain-containing protein
MWNLVGSLSMTHKPGLPRRHPGERNLMSYRLNLDEPVPDALRAAALERLERAAKRLREDHRDDPVEAVHGARKDLKKARALLRLARPDVPAKVYRQQNRALRDIGRAMSGGRDADVMVQTCDALAERFGDEHPKRQFAALHRRLEAHARNRRDDSDRDALATSLNAALERANDWPLQGCDAGTLVAGEQRVYRAGRRALAAVEASPADDECWHEWRKRAKDLWYHQRLLANAWSGPIKALADECDALGTLLGDDHDLATLADTLTGPDGTAAPPSVDLGALTELIARRRSELQAQSRALGHRIYAETPKAHARRMAGYLAAREPQPA